MFYKTQPSNVISRCLIQFLFILLCVCGLLSIINYISKQKQNNINIFLKYIIISNLLYWLVNLGTQNKPLSGLPFTPFLSIANNYPDCYDSGH